MALQPTSQELQEFKKYFPDREITERDVQNVRSNPQAFKMSYEQITGSPKKELKTPAGQGQVAGETPVAESEVNAQIGQEETKEAAEPKQFSAQEKIEMMTEGEPQVFSLMEKLLKAKQAEVAPYAEKRAKIKEKMGKLSIADYKKLSPEAASQALQSDYARMISRIDYLDQQKADAQTGLDDIILAAKDIYGAQLSALGLKVESEQDAVDFAFDPTILVSSTNPPSNLPTQYIEVWNQAAAEAKRQQALSERPRGGGGSAKKDPFQSDAEDLRLQMSQYKMDWGSAWDTMRAMYPEKSNEEIDQALGGSATYIPQMQSTAQGEIDLGGSWFNKEFAEKYSAENVAAYQAAQRQAELEGIKAEAQAKSEGTSAGQLDEFDINLGGEWGEKE